MYPSNLNAKSDQIKPTYGLQYVKEVTKELAELAIKQIGFPALYEMNQTKELCDLAVQASPILNDVYYDDYYDDDYYENLAAEYDTKLNEEETKEINYYDYPCRERAERGLACYCACDDSSIEDDSDDGTFGGMEPYFSIEDLRDRDKDTYTRSDYLP